MQNAIQGFIKLISSLVVVLTLVLISSATYAQDNTIKTNLANLAIGGGSLHFERTLNDVSSAQIGVFFTTIDFGSTRFSGFGIIPQYRYYPGKNEVPHGFFLAPLLSYQSFSLKADVSSFQGTTEAKANYSLIGAGLDLGKQWLINRSFSVELSLGATFNSTNLKITSSTGSKSTFDTGSIGSFAPRFGLSLGYAF